MPAASRLGFHDPRENLLVIGSADRMAVGGRLGRVSRHRLSVPAVVIGVDQTMRLRSDGVHEGRAVLVRPGCWHSIDTRTGRLAVFLLPPHALRSDQMGWVQDLPHPRRWVELGEALLDQSLSVFDPIDLCLARERLRAGPIDDRLQAALTALQGALDENLSVAEVAAVAHLSPSRLMALAHEQLGTSLRSYRRWLRAFRVVRDYAGGLSLTEAALAAGFASSPHLSAAAREQFGVRPSDVLRPETRATIRMI